MSANSKRTPADKISVPVPLQPSPSSSSFISVPPRAPAFVNTTAPTIMPHPTMGQHQIVQYVTTNPLTQAYHVPMGIPYPGGMTFAPMHSFSLQPPPFPSPSSTTTATGHPPSTIFPHPLPSTTVQMVQQPSPHPLMPTVTTTTQPPSTSAVKSTTATVTASTTTPMPVPPGNTNNSYSVVYLQSPPTNGGFSTLLPSHLGAHQMISQPSMMMPGNIVPLTMVPSSSTSHSTPTMTMVPAMPRMIPAGMVQASPTMVVPHPMMNPTYVTTTTATSASSSASKPSATAAASTTSKGKTQSKKTASTTKLTTTPKQATTPKTGTTPTVADPSAKLESPPVVVASTATTALTPNIPSVAFPPTPVILPSVTPTATTASARRNRVKSVVTTASIPLPASTSLSVPSTVNVTTPIPSTAPSITNTATMPSTAVHPLSSTGTTATLSTTTATTDTVSTDPPHNAVPASHSSAAVTTASSTTITPSVSILFPPKGSTFTPSVIPSVTTTLRSLTPTESFSTLPTPLAQSATTTVVPTASAMDSGNGSTIVIPVVPTLRSTAPNSPLLRSTATLPLVPTTAADEIMDVMDDMNPTTNTVPETITMTVPERTVSPHELSTGTPERSSSPTEAYIHKLNRQRQQERRQKAEALLERARNLTPEDFRSWSLLDMIELVNVRYNQASQAQNDGSTDANAPLSPVDAGEVDGNTEDKEINAISTAADPKQRAILFEKYKEVKRTTRFVTADCPLCNTKYSTKGGIMYHLTKAVCVAKAKKTDNTAKSDDPVPNNNTNTTLQYYCPMCNKGFFSVPGVRYHLEWNAKRKVCCLDENTVTEPATQRRGARTKRKTKRLHIENTDNNFYSSGSDAEKESTTQTKEDTEKPVYSLPSPVTLHPYFDVHPENVRFVDDADQIQRYMQGAYLLPVYQEHEWPPLHPTKKPLNKPSTNIAMTTTTNENTNETTLIGTDTNTTAADTEAPATEIVSSTGVPNAQSPLLAYLRGMFKQGLAWCQPLPGTSFRYARGPLWGLDITSELILSSNVNRNDEDITLSSSTISSSSSSVSPIIRSWVAVNHHSLDRPLHSIGAVTSGPNILQIWKIDHTLPTTPSSSSIPDPSSDKSIRIVPFYGIAYDCDTIVDLAWCPNIAPTSTRLGVLATAMGDGTVRVYAVPHPSMLEKLRQDHTFSSSTAFSFPLIHLVPLFVCGVRGQPAIRIKWNPLLPGQLFVGTVIGSTQIYHLNTIFTGSENTLSSSVTSLSGNPTVTTLNPAECGFRYSSPSTHTASTESVPLTGIMQRIYPDETLIQAGSIIQPIAVSSVRDIAISHTSPYIVATGHADGGLRLWDTRKPSTPIIDYVCTARMITSVAFSTGGDTIFVATDAGDISEISLSTWVAEVILSPGSLNSDATNTGVIWEMQTLPLSIPSLSSISSHLPRPQPLPGIFSFVSYNGGAHLLPTLSGTKRYALLRPGQKFHSWSTEQQDYPGLRIASGHDRTDLTILSYVLSPVLPSAMSAVTLGYFLNPDRPDKTYGPSLHLPQFAMHRIRISLVEVPDPVTHTSTVYAITVCGGAEGFVRYRIVNITEEFAFSYHERARKAINSVFIRQSTGLIESTETLRRKMFTETAMSTSGGKGTPGGSNRNLGVNTLYASTNVVVGRPTRPNLPNHKKGGGNARKYDTKTSTTNTKPKRKRGRDEYSDDDEESLGDESTTSEEEIWNSNEETPEEDDEENDSSNLVENDEEEEEEEDGDEGFRRRSRPMTGRKVRRR